MLRVSWTEHRTNESLLSVMDERREILKAIRTRMVGHMMRHENELSHRIIEGKIESKRSKDVQELH